MDERRAFKRLPAEVEVRIRQVDGDFTTTAHGKDLSGGGIQLMTNEVISKGTILEIEVLHPAPMKEVEPLRAMVKVVRVEGDLPPYEVAAEFIEVH